MANSKISALTDGNPAQSGDEIPIARSGANYKITVGSITSLGGDVDGPASSTDNAVARFDGTTGKLIQNSGVTIEDDGSMVIPANSTNAGLRITQTGSGNALSVEDSANPDATPFVVDADGRVLSGLTTPITTLFGNIPGVQINAQFGVQAMAFSRFSADQFGADIDFVKSRNATVGSQTVLVSGDQIANLNFAGSDGTQFVNAASIAVNIDGTPGTNDMPGRLVFSTTADGASSVTERMRIDNAGSVGIGATSLTGWNLRVSKNITGGTSAFGVGSDGTIQSGVTSDARMFFSQPNTAATAFTLTGLYGFSAAQGTIGAGSSVTNQYGFFAGVTLTGATNNYGFYSNISSGTGRWNFYANGTAANYFAGDMQLDKTVTAAGTTGAQTINKNAGTVNFAAAATSLVVTDSRVTANSIIICTVGTNDTTMKSVAAVAGAGSFTLHANAAATAETRVNFLIIN
jgi:hypothetical protein